MMGDSSLLHDNDNIFNTIFEEEVISGIKKDNENLD